MQRVISSDSGESNDSQDAKSRAENQKNGQLEKKAKLSNDKEKGPIVNKEIVKSKGKQIEEVTAKKEIKTTTVKDMLRAKRDKLQNTAESSSGIKSTGQAITTTEDSSSSSGSSDSSGDENDEEDIGNEPSGNADGPGKARETIVENTVAIEVASTSELPGAVSETNGEVAVEPVEVKLPENLQENLLQKIKQLEELVKTTSKAFSDNESHTLLYE